MSTKGQRSRMCLVDLPREISRVKFLEEWAKISAGITEKMFSLSKEGIGWSWTLTHERCYGGFYRSVYHACHELQLDRLRRKAWLLLEHMNEVAGEEWDWLDQVLMQLPTGREVQEHDVVGFAWALWKHRMELFDCGGAETVITW